MQSSVSGTFGASIEGASPLSSAAAEVDEAINAIGSAIDELRMRLEPVLVPQVVVAVQSAGGSRAPAPEAAEAPAVAGLRRYARRAGDLNNTLREILSRLAV